MRRLIIVLLLLATGGIATWLLTRARSPVVQNPVVSVGPATTRPLMAACGHHVVFVAPDGTVWVWGADAPNGAVEPSLPADPRPWKLSDERGWQAIATGYFFTAGIKTNGTLWLWGTLHSPTGVQPRTPTSPRQVDEATNWVSVGAGSQSVCALKSDGTLWTWGANHKSQPGDGTGRPSTKPIRLDEATNWVKVAAAGYHTLGLRRDGTLWVWGSDPLAGSGGWPAQVGRETNWVDIACAEFLSVARQVDGRCWAWGNTNVAGVWFAWPSLQSGSLTQIPTNLNWRTSAGGGGYLLLLTEDGRLRVWGSHYPDKLGRGTSDASSATAGLPVQVGDRLDWGDVAAAGDLSYGLTADGQVWAWGIRLDRAQFKRSLSDTVSTFFAVLMGRGSRSRGIFTAASTPIPEPLFRFVCATNTTADFQNR